MDRLKLIDLHLNSMIDFSLKYDKLYVKFNRPDKRNCFSLAAISSLSTVVRQFPDKEMVFTGAGDKAFTSGGDLQSFIDRGEHFANEYASTLSLFHHVEHRTPDRLAVLKGVTVGGGTVWSNLSTFSVATDSTIWAAPENEAGFFTDGGVSFHFNKLKPEGLGLYLALTTRRLTGAEAYSVGLTTHFIRHDKLDELIRLTETMPVKQAADALHTDPPREACPILDRLADIHQCFGNASSVEEVFGRLASRNTPWALTLISEMNNLCPLSLVISLTNFNLAKGKSFKQVLETEYDAAMQMIVHKNANLLIGVNHKLVEKLKTRAPWSPAHVTEVDESLVSVIFANKEGPHLNIQS